MRNPFLNASFWLAGVSAGALTLAGLAAAQTPAAPAPAEPAAAAEEEASTGSEEVVVTGSRIRKPEFESVYPASSIGAQQIEQRGITNVLDALNTLPATGIGATPVGTQASFGAGAAFVNLFDLGSARTLTLVNGRRFIGGNQATLFGQAGSGLQVDLNTIPTALIDRIEVISVGGAPAYGADAIAGTVNVVLKRDFEGNEIDVQWGKFERGFGDNYRIRGTSGANFAEGKGNLVVAVEQAEVEGFTDEVSRRRSISYSFVPNPRNSAPFTTAAEPNGVFDNYLIPNRRLPSLTTGGAIFRSGASPVYLGGTNGADRQLLIDRPGINPLLALNTAGSLISRPATAAETALGTAARPITRVAVPLLFNPDGTIRSMNVGVIAADQVLSATNSIGGDGLDLAPFTALQTNLTRQLGTLNGSYEFSPMFRVFAEVLYAKIKGSEPVNQPGFNSNAFGGVSASLGFRTDNPFLSAQARTTLLDTTLNLDPASTIVNNVQNRFSGLTAAGPWAGCGVNGMPLTPVAGFEAAGSFAGCPTPAAGERVFFTSRIYDDIIGTAPSTSVGETQRYVLGVDGDFELLNQAWSYDAAFIYGESIGRSRNTTILQAQFNAARDAIRNPDSQIVCRVNSANAAERTASRFFFRYTTAGAYTGTQLANNAVIDPSTPAPPPGFERRRVGDPLGASEAVLNACAPVNLFGRGTASDAARAYLTGVLENENVNEQTSFELNLQGGLFDLPGGTVDLAFGFSWRKESSTFLSITDVARFGLGRSAAIVDTAGEFTSKEYYAETSIPIFGGDFRFPALYELTLNGAYRYIDNDLAGTDEAWTYGATYSPLEWVTLRGNITRAVRAPALTELFLPNQDAFATAADPCDSTLINSGPVPAVRRANCQAQAAALGFGGLATFISDVRFATVRGVTQGSQTLTNEVADSETFGIIVRPPIGLGEMAIAADFVKINLTQSIENFGLGALFSSCYDNPTFPTAACGRFTRESGASARPFQIALGSPDAPAFRGGFINAGFRNMEGITGTFDWSFDVAELFQSEKDYGNLQIRLNYFYYDLLEVSILGTGTDLDPLDGEVSRPYNSHDMTVTYNFGPTTVSLAWSHQGEAKFDQQLSAENREQTKVAAYDLFNFSLLYDFNDNLQGRVIVNNLFDTEPPFPSSSIAYDQVGRAFAVGLRARF